MFSNAIVHRDWELSSLQISHLLDRIENDWKSLEKNSSSIAILQKNAEEGRKLTILYAGINISIRKIQLFSCIAWQWFACIPIFSYSSTRDPPPFCSFHNLAQDTLVHPQARGSRERTCQARAMPLSSVPICRRYSRRVNENRCFTELLIVYSSCIFGCHGVYWFTAYTPGVERRGTSERIAAQDIFIRDRIQSRSRRVLLLHAMSLLCDELRVHNGFRYCWHDVCGLGSTLLCALRNRGVTISLRY